MVGILGSQCNRKNGVGQKLFFRGQIPNKEVKVIPDNSLIGVVGRIRQTRKSYPARDRLTRDDA